jgi:hypothetical protein
VRRCARAKTPEAIADTRVLSGVEMAIGARGICSNITSPSMTCRIVGVGSTDPTLPGAGTASRRPACVQSGRRGRPRSWVQRARRLLQGSTQGLQRDPIPRVAGAADDTGQASPGGHCWRESHNAVCVGTRGGGYGGVMWRSQLCGQRAIRHAAAVTWRQRSAT